MESSSSAFYYNFDQYLVSDANDPSRGWGIFGRIGAADGDSNLIESFYSLGLGGTGVIPGREDDRFGIGYYYLETSDVRLGLFTDDDEHGFEVFYNWSPAPWLELTANFQAIDGAVRFSDTATVFGFRGRMKL